MGAVRLSFVLAAGLSAWTICGGPAIVPAWAQDTPAQRPEAPAQPKAEPPRTEPQQRVEPQPKAPAAKAPTKRAPAPGADRDEGKSAAKKAAPPPSCGWIGKRVIQSLLRDDAVTAQDFDRLYRTFDCSGDYLRHAFDCTVSDGAPQTANEAQVRLDACWEDPSATKIEIPTPAPGRTTPTTPPGSGTSQPKGAAGGKAPPDASSTPNYPKGK
jgi:hypothetical protein